MRPLRDAGGRPAGDALGSSPLPGIDLHSATPLPLIIGTAAGLSVGRGRFSAGNSRLWDLRVGFLSRPNSAGGRLGTASHLAGVPAS